MKSKTYIISNTSELHELINRMRSAEIVKPLRITISVHSASRTREQNAYMWICYEAIRKHLIETTGEYYSADDLHLYFKNKFLPVEVKEIDGEIITHRLDTSDLNVKRMAEYLDDLAMYCETVLFLTLPDPEEFKRKKRIKKSEQRTDRNKQTSA